MPEYELNPDNIPRYYNPEWKAETSKEKNARLERQSAGTDTAADKKQQKIADEAEKFNYEQRQKYYDDYSRGLHYQNPSYPQLKVLKGINDVVNTAVGLAGVFKRGGRVGFGRF